MKISEKFKHNQTYFTHRDDKNHLTHEQLLILLSEGFRDCSWSDDENASFYLEGNTFINNEHMYDPLAIYVISNRDGEKPVKPEYADVYFYIYDTDTDEHYHSESLEAIINVYKTILIERRQKHLKEQS